MNDLRSLIPDALGFFDALAANNSRDWFTAHKPDFEARVKRSAEALLDVVGAWIAAETGVTHTPKLYRIHRDLRFSRDKTPYNTHLHLQWSDPNTGICQLFGVSCDYVCAGVGAMQFSKPALDRWRAGVGSEGGAAIAAEIVALVKDGHRLGPPELKRVPAPFSQDHSRGDLLKRKSLILWHDFTPHEQTDPVNALKESLARLDGLRRSLGALISP